MMGYEYGVISDNAGKPFMVVAVDENGIHLTANRETLIRWSEYFESDEWIQNHSTSYAPISSVFRSPYTNLKVGYLPEKVGEYTQARDLLESSGAETILI